MGTSVLVFHERPKPVPGDLRITWRIAMTLLALHFCRRNSASFIKLHILNGALRSKVARNRLINALDGKIEEDTCTFHLEPAFSRNLDLLVGKGLAQWTIASSRLGLRLSALGIKAATDINSETGILANEREFLETCAGSVTEKLVTRIVSAGQNKML